MCLHIISFSTQNYLPVSSRKFHFFFLTIFLHPAQTFFYKKVSLSLKLMSMLRIRLWKVPSMLLVFDLKKLFQFHNLESSSESSSFLCFCHTILLLLFWKWMQLIFSFIIQFSSSITGWLTLSINRFSSGPMKSFLGVEELLRLFFYWMLCSLNSIPSRRWFILP